MNHDAARRYRLQAAEFASPVGVIVQAYDQIVRALQQAAGALEGGNIEYKTKEVDRALLIASHLQSMLDHEAGPKVAAKLEAFYETMRYQIVKTSAESSGTGLREIAGYFRTLREAWQVVERENPALPAGAAPRRQPAPPAPLPASTDLSAETVPSDWSA